MSKTLFFYLFKDLVRIFLMTSGALAGIMSFAGLLRPLTENGLDLGQVSRILRYMSPAMTTYSLPVAALFATTVVYGRFSSDNELTAMRAGGISYLSFRRFGVALPALVLGLLAALISLGLLCFVVPVYSLKVEQVIYSNIAKVIASKIEKNHEIDFKNGTDSLEIFAQEARLLAQDPADPSGQQVELIGPAIITYDDTFHSVPTKFWVASKAMVNILRYGLTPESGASLHVRLTDGSMFPRQLGAGAQAGVADTSFGPIEIPSIINENVKFMTVGRLTELVADPVRSQKVQTVLRTIIRRLEDEQLLNSIADKINGPATAEGTTVCTLTALAAPREIPDTYTIVGEHLRAYLKGQELIIDGPETGDGRTVRYRQRHGSTDTLLARSREVHVRCRADAPNSQLAVSIELMDTELRAGDVISPRTSFIRGFNVAMTPEILAIANKPLDQYMHDPKLSPGESLVLDHERVFVNNAASSELHSRAAFALSCLVLVMVGCALGTMFRSGNFLTAFAVSFVPALLVITLIVCGQQIATHVPFDMKNDPLNTGLCFIWIGNLAVFLTAGHLTWKLQRR